jgi:hypothetical protein
VIDFIALQVTARESNLTTHPSELDAKEIERHNTQNFKDEEE